jgi:hypothetical protein
VRALPGNAAFFPFMIVHPMHGFRFGRGPNHSNPVMVLLCDVLRS